MESIQCSSLSKYIEKILDYKTAYKIENKSDYVYRGQASSLYKLLPSIGRIKNYKKELEKSIFNDFKSKYHSYASFSLSKDMDVLFLAQHYGLPTRLLDWTYNPLIALYFACCSSETNDGVVFVRELPNSGIKEEKGDISPLDIDQNIFIIPDYWDKRYINQKGLFELFANPQEENENNISIKICIPSSAKANILTQLELIGFDNSFIYPSLDSLSKDLIRKFQIKY